MQQIFELDLGVGGAIEDRAGAEDRAAPDGGAFVYAACITYIKKTERPTPCAPPSQEGDRTIRHATCPPVQESVDMYDIRDILASQVESRVLKT